MASPALRSEAAAGEVLAWWAVRQAVLAAPGVQLELLAPAFLDAFRASAPLLLSINSCTPEVVGSYCDAVAEFAEKAFPLRQDLRACDRLLDFGRLVTGALQVVVLRRGVARVLRYLGRDTARKLGAWMQLALDALEGYTLDACHAGLDSLQMLQATVPECLAPYMGDIIARLFLCFLRFGAELRLKLALSLRTLAGFAPGELRAALGEMRGAAEEVGPKKADALRAFVKFAQYAVADLETDGIDLVQCAGVEVQSVL